MLQNLNAPVIITSAAHVAALKAVDIPEESLLLIEEAFVPEKLYFENTFARRLEGIIDTDPYCIIHTSGSTGIPKGVALNHRNTIDFVDWAFDRWDSTARKSWEAWPQSTSTPTRSSFA